MPAAYLTSAKGRALNTSATSGNLDSTGASLLVAPVGVYSGEAGSPALADSKSNSWTALTARNSGGVCNIRSYYSSPSSVGSSHNATYSNSGTIAAAIVFAAFSGIKATSPLDQENGNTTTSATSLSTGSITPSQNNCLILTWITSSPTSGQTNFAVDSGFTLIDGYDGLGGTNEACWFAYKVQTTAAAINAGWSWTNNGGDGYAAGIASFFPASGSLPAFIRPHQAVQRASFY